MLLDISIACLFVDAIILNGIFRMISRYEFAGCLFECWDFFYVFMESLILAQDERWRRA